MESGIPDEETVVPDVYTLDADQFEVNVLAVEAT